MDQRNEVRSLADIIDSQSLSGKTLICTDSDSDSIEEDDDSSTDLDIGLAASNLTLSADNQLTYTRQYYGMQSMATLRVLDVLINVLEYQACASDAKLLMFAAAAHSDGYRSNLVPVPSIFMGDAFYDIDGLRRIVSSWPSSHRLLQSLSSNYRINHLAETDISHIHLLHWILVWQAYPSLRRVDGGELRWLCKKMNLKRPLLNPGYILQVIYKDDPRCYWKSTSPHAYFGCPLYFLYRLLIMRDTPRPMHLYELPELAAAQCSDTNCSGWMHSRFGRAPRCLVICQLVDHYEIRLQEHGQPEFVVHDPSSVRVRYLLFYSGVKKRIELPLNFASRLDYNNSNMDNKAKTKRSGNNRTLFRIARWLKKHALKLIHRQSPV
ncbi:PREDICTED: mono [ADP-ribose] polymerase PARP16 [Drosophila arizonae]|uniref:Mono [ADP-ribose] polymerase PARP16 n=1 Tax=Drosophila arizonae TaxID=7263 RepID=A0ABM1PPT9_DROAR|nr:PREDICTED: mono [ADP-ribose] polymerase PARP16 [Drosophila arizonae]